MRNDFAVFILSHGRANNLVTVPALKKCGYTGQYYIVCDDEDEQLNDYIKNFGKEHVIVFSKDDVDGTFDIMDNFNNGRGVPVYARNILHDLAKERGLTYFLELEDDYSSYSSRVKTKNNQLMQFYIRDLDSIIDAMIEFLDTSGAITVTMAQDGDFIGGIGGKIYKQRLARKAMQTFFCRTDKPFQFLGRFNDDVNAYVEHGKRGTLFFSVCDLSVHQGLTQQTSGGITAAYLQFGTYVKSFYSVMLNPSAVKIHAMGTSHLRIHHHIDWKYAVPQIVSDKYKTI